MKKQPPVSLFLEKENIPHRVFHHETPIRSMQEAADARGQDITQLVRSILFRTGKDEFMMALVAGPNQLSWSALRAYLGQSRMTMASKEEVLEVTGYVIGTVAPFGLKRPLRLLADESVFVHDEVSFGSGQRNTAIIMKMGDFRKALGDVEIGAFVKGG